MVKVRVFVTLKPSLLDSAGRTVERSLDKLGFEGVDHVRIGKLIEMNLAHYDQAKLDQMCVQLLSNPVIEDYKIEVIE